MVRLLIQLNSQTDIQLLASGKLDEAMHLFDGGFYEQAPQNLQKILNVAVYNPDESDHFPGANDILIFAEENPGY